jgi:hypothetical protein
MSRERGALRSLGKSDREEMVIGSELFFVLFFFLNSWVLICF